MADLLAAGRDALALELVNASPPDSELAPFRTTDGARWTDAQRAALLKVVSEKSR